jgi:predicted nucleic acid-binding protein
VVARAKGVQRVGHPPSSDPDDDIFLECAQAARAHYIVTGNLKDFPTTWADTQIVSARQFLDAVAEIEDGDR